MERVGTVEATKRTTQNRRVETKKGRGRQKKREGNTDGNKRLRYKDDKEFESKRLRR